MAVVKRLFLGGPLDRQYRAVDDDARQWRIAKPRDLNASDYFYTSTTNPAIPDPFYDVDTYYKCTGHIGLTLIDYMLYESHYETGDQGHKFCDYIADLYFKDLQNAA